jgi:hypothetical protein
MHYRRLRKWGDTLYTGSGFVGVASTQLLGLTPEERFWKYVDKDGPVPEHVPYLGQCWLWTAGRDKGGYGKFTVDGGYIRAHRFSYEMVHGPVPDDKPQVLHRCDNPSCVRPSHLWAGTNEDNTADKENKGRHFVAPRPPFLPCGTEAAYARHRRAKEPACELCRAAVAAAVGERRRLRRLGA